MLRLERITGNNLWDIVALQVHESQRSFVAPNDRSILEAYACLMDNGHAFPFGLYDGETPVGFLMVGYSTDDSWLDAPAIARDNYNIWRLMIDKRHQGKGYGRQAMTLALDFIRTWPCGKAEKCWLSYEPENTVARALYHSFGFTETGDMDGGEVIAAVEL